MNCNTCHCRGEDDNAPYCFHFSRVYPDGRDIQWSWKGGYRKLSSDTCPRKSEEKDNDTTDTDTSPAVNTRTGE